ncbi:MAG: tetratricopeptide repeat protein [Aquificaceae bacterium]|nr:tetratricopeptide repeat protein [Aquificaceae bacterium]MDW8097515.1 tetratricopeptide repeat protein [Aquificaceae bacterium]
MRKGAVLLFLLFSCAAKQEQVKTQWQYHYDLGMSSYMAKNYSEAIANFFRASQIAPGEPKVWNALGLAYMEVQEYAKAENAFLKALQVDKSYTEAKLNLGILHYRQGQYEKSMRILGEVIQDDAFPQKHMAFYYLGRVNQAVGNNREYINNLRRATAYNPMFLDAQLELAQALENEGEYSQARAVYVSLMNNGIMNTTVDLNMARLEYKMGNYQSAKNYIKRVLEDRQTTPQLKAQAYDLLSQVLIAEQTRIIQPRVEVERPTQPVKVQEPQNPPKEPPPQETSKVRTYRIQLGAFSSANFAKGWRDKLEKELNLRDLTVVESSGVFKVLYGSFATREDALKELTRLKSLNLYGFVVQE